MDLLLHVIGYVRSPLKSRENAPKMESEGAPEVWIDIDPIYAEAVDTLVPGKQILIFTWLHQADRSCLKVHPRGNPDNPLRGVFNTRSPDRPNPVGLHLVDILEIAPGPRLCVGPLEAIDGTPVIDIKPPTGRETGTK